MVMQRLGLQAYEIFSMTISGSNFVTTQYIQCVTIFQQWIPAFAGMTTLYRFQASHADKGRPVIAIQPGLSRIS